MPDGAPRIRGFRYKGRRRYSLTICSHGRCGVFTDPEIVSTIMLQIRRAAEACGFRILAYCFMPDHLHLLVEGVSADADLQRFVRSWKQKTAFEHAKRTGRRLWQVGFFDHVLRSEESTHRHVLYVLGNPVRAGLAGMIGEYPFAGCDAEWLDAPEKKKSGPDGPDGPDGPET